MTNQQTNKYVLSAEQFAELNQVKPQSVRARLCRTGSYFGVRPAKLANGRLAFPAVQVSGHEHRAVAEADRKKSKAMRDSAGDAQPLTTGEAF